MVARGSNRQYFVRVFGINDICPGYLEIFTGEFCGKFVERVNRGSGRGGGEGLGPDLLAWEHGEARGTETLTSDLCPRALSLMMRGVAREKYRDTRLGDEQVNYKSGANLLGGTKRLDDALHLTRA